MAAELEIVTYGKGFAIFGNTKPYSEELKAKGFRFNGNLVRGDNKEPGWIVGPSGEETAREFVNQVNIGKVKTSTKTAPRAKASTQQSNVTSFASLKAKSFYSQLSSYTDLYIANRLALSGEDVTDNALANRYNFHVSMLKDSSNDADLDPSFVHVFSSNTYSEVSELDGVQVGEELGKNKIAIPNQSSLFDAQMCLTAVRMAVGEERSVAYAIQIVKLFNENIGDSIEKLIPVKQVIKKTGKSSSGRTVPRKAPVEVTPEPEISGSDVDTVPEVQESHNETSSRRLRSSPRPIKPKKREEPVAEEEDN